MSCFINRGGEQFGPYSWDEVNQYVNQGYISMTDLARIGPDSHWTSLSHLLAGVVALPPAPIYTVPDRANSVTVAPPSMHWLLLLFLGLLTSGVFLLFWIFVQASWVRKIDPRNRSTLYFGLSIAADLSSVLVLLIALALDRVIVLSGLFALAGYACILASPVFAFAGVFAMKHSLERYYTTVEPIGLRLSGFLTFFLNVYYFQYHFSRIADWKRTGVLAG